MATSHSIARTRAWFPGRLFALHQLRDVEVHSNRHCRVQVAGTTLFGTADELEALAYQLLHVVERAGS